MKHTYRTPAERLPPIARMAIWRIEYDSDGRQAGFTVVDLPDGHSDVPPWPGPAPSDSFFATEAEAVQEVTLRLSGKEKCDCECGGYPRGPARFLPGHDSQPGAQ